MQVTMTTAEVKIEATIEEFAALRDIADLVLGGKSVAEHAFTDEGGYGAHFVIRLELDD